jgi:hypothetical protein
VTPRGALAPSLVALVKVAVSVAVLAGGFRAVSDDDFARVVIAEQWARAPRLDPSGTSWLPLPFWIVGAAMRVLGRSLETARGTAFVLGVAAALIVYVAARWIGEDRGAAAVGAVVAAVVPWSARLGVATVPELPAAALTLLAMASIAPAGEEGEKRRIWGGAALLAATLSRYEAWPVAAVFAVACAVSRAPRGEAGRGARAAPIVLALAGPIAWMLWNRHAHGDALHFVARVTAYRQALGGGGEGSAAARLWAYPVAMAREEPEVLALLGAAIAITLMRAREARERLARYAWPAATAAAQIAALSIAMVKDGAPTHHPERAVLSAILLAAVMAGALGAQAIQAGEGRAWKAVVLLGAAAIAAVTVRPRTTREGFVQRGNEEAIGRALAGVSRPGEPVLLEVVDYGYLAVEAALGRPEDVVQDRSIDPRDPKVPSSFDDPAALSRRLAASGARWVVSRNAVPVASVLGEPVAVRGAWRIYAVLARPGSPG